MATAGTVWHLWRYPVKSMRGEQRSTLEIDRRGVVGDRLWAVHEVDGKIGSGKSTRRFRRMDELLHFEAAYPDKEIGPPLVTFPDGIVHFGGDRVIHTALSNTLDFPVYLAEEDALSHMDAAPLHVVTTSTLKCIQALRAAGAMDERRFRPNVVLAADSITDAAHKGFVEDSWVGRELQLGGVRLTITERTERCVVVNKAQSDLEFDGSVLQTVTAANQLYLGVYADVSTTGTVRTGDTATLC